MEDYLALWHQDHLNFALLIQLLDEQVAAFHAGDRPDYELMTDIVHYLRAYSDLLHHPREDVAFARMAVRDPALSPLLSRLMQEHRVLAWSGEDLLRHLEETATDCITPRIALEAAAATFVQYYRRHLDIEESRILPRAAALLDAHDWMAVAAAGPILSDPLFGEVTELRFHGLRDAVSVLKSTRPQRAVQS